MRTILITGGTGTFGRAMARIVRRADPAVHLRIFSRDEQKQASLRRWLGEGHTSYLLGDVRDLERLRLACQGVDLVVHAAALKIVPAGEYDPSEFVQTNVIGSMNVMRAALDCQVPHTILLSSDKAVHPVNLYGATKMVAEKVFLQANAYSASGAVRYNVVRYGNVMGSRGSVWETYRALLQKGVPLPLTHPAMTRFWMAVETAVWLVRMASAEAGRGELWVPQLEAFRLVDLIEACYQQAGVTPPAEASIIGVRQGEKLHERLMTSEEQQRAVFRGATRWAPAVYVVPAAVRSWPETTMQGVPVPLDMPAYDSETWPARLGVADLAARLTRLAVIQAEEADGER